MNILEQSYDVVVLGAGPAGFAAAIRAARDGVRVALVDRNGYLGGNIHSNIPWLAFLNAEADKRIIGGIAQEVVDRLTAQGACLGHSPCPIHISVTTIDANAFEIEAAKMALDAGIDCFLHAELSDARVEDGVLKSVGILGKGRRYELKAQVFIDATGDGDLGYLSGSEVEYGKNGSVMPGSLVFLMDQVDPEACFRFLDAHPEHIQQNFPDYLRDIHGPITADFFRANPSYVTYFMKDYVKGIHDRGDTRHYLPAIVFGSTPVKGRVYVLATRALGVNVTDIRDISRAELQSRVEIADAAAFLRDWVPGFENGVIHSINPVMGFREGYRIMGRKKLTHANHREVGTEDSVALCSYIIDIHPQKKSSDAVEDAPKDVWILEPYGIPYGCLVSRSVQGLMMAGRCISTDSVMLGSCRIIPTCFATGEAAGAGAAIAVRNGITPAEVKPEQVRKQLRAVGAIVSPEDAVPFTPRYAPLGGGKTG